MTRLGVLGVGRIGGEVAYLAALTGVADKLALYDRTESLLRAQVLDIRHTGIPVEISTSPRDILDTDVCVVAAGLPRTPDIRTRADLLMANLPVIQECGELLKEYPGLLVTVTNPMDINNYFLHRLTGIPKERCIGFGGQLDSARFQWALAGRGIKGPTVVLGEHGENQVPVFSRLPVPFSEEKRSEILRELRGASMEVIRGKGGTVFGPAYHIVSLAKMLLSGTQETVPCSAVLDGEYGISGCSLGVPVRLGREGIREIVQWDLDPAEAAAMAQAGAFVSDLCRTVVK